MIGGNLLQDGKFYEATYRENLEIMDRVGGGDSFALVIYGFLRHDDGAANWEHRSIGDDYSWDTLWSHWLMWRRLWMVVVPRC